MGMIVPDGTFRSVMKFGGSCLKSSQDISAIAERISEIDHYPVVVVSAFFGVTDRLFDAIHEAKEGRVHVPTFLRWVVSCHKRGDQ